MKLETSFTALVIVGGWNQHIFTPHWIRKNLLSAEEEKLTVEMLSPFSSSFNAQPVSPRISSKEVRILLQGNRLSLSPVEIENKNSGYKKSLSNSLIVSHIRLFPNTVSIFSSLKTISIES
jgi:hypothetical protein